MDAIQLKNPLAIRSQSSDAQLDPLAQPDTQALAAGDWLVIYSDGTQEGVPDAAFRAEYEEVFVARRGRPPKGEPSLSVARPKRKRRRRSRAKAAKPLGKKGEKAAA